MLFKKIIEENLSKKPHDQKVEHSGYKMAIANDRKFFSICDNYYLWEEFYSVRSVKKLNTSKNLWS